MTDMPRLYLTSKFIDSKSLNEKPRVAPKGEIFFIVLSSEVNSSLNLKP